MYTINLFLIKKNKIVTFGLKYEITKFCISDKMDEIALRSYNIFKFLMYFVRFSAVISQAVNNMLRDLRNLFSTDSYTYRCTTQMQTVVVWKEWHVPIGLNVLTSCSCKPETERPGRDPADQSVPGLLPGATRRTLSPVVKCLSEFFIQRAKWRPKT